MTSGPRMALPERLRTRETELGLVREEPAATRAVAMIPVAMIKLPTDRSVYRSLAPTISLFRHV